MHGWKAGEEERKRAGRHMWTVPSRASVAGDGSSSSSSSNSANSFNKGNMVGSAWLLERDLPARCKKQEVEVASVVFLFLITVLKNFEYYKVNQFITVSDGRKISVGDCALFKPPQDSPPFIGIIRALTSGEENKLKLSVNWLYRPAEVKLGKGILLEAAPNEIFFSFHKDEIPAASLLHPCKVAFLPKGVELPSGFCSFVCRRVYDIKRKCLWWLTDQDFIDGWQEEIDQLLSKTRIEMHAALQPGGGSPKRMNGPTSTSQLKPGSDSVQNSASSFPSQVKGKKRERGDQGSEPVKRERSTKIDDGDFGHARSETILRSEIAKITEKGGLVDFEGVEKLVQLMVPEKNEKKIDLVCRSMLAGVVAATDKFDCLSRFVQLKGLPVFDEWLQEVHKGKLGDGSSPKDGDKSIEEFLLVSLRALDKLPVNLHALKMCNIGKSVNHLRSHKNVEIQKKARSLVDTWKKRVEAEMDAKSGSNQAVSWPSRTRNSEFSHGGSKNSGGSSDVAIKSSTMQPSASKIASAKLVQGETATKSASTSPGCIKSSPSPASGSTNLKDGQPRNASVSGASDLPSTPARDEKSSSSSQSHNNSQSCSSDHAKTGGFSGKEDARSSTAGSMTVNKISGGSSRSRKSTNGFPGPAQSGGQRDHGSSRNSSSHRNPASEKLSQSGVTCEKAPDTPIVEGNSHKLIVKIPNRGRSPAQSACAASFEEPSVMNSRASSPVLLDKHDEFDRNLKEKSDGYRPNIPSDLNNESWQSNDFKDVLTGSDEGDGSPATVPEEEPGRTGDETGKMVEVSKAASSLSGNDLKSGKLREGSFSSINALIESCVKYSEAKASMPVGDDAGMNLLASVAAGEISKSGMASPADSPQRNTPVVDHSCNVNDSRIKSSPRHDLGQDQSKSVDSADDEREKQVPSGTVWVKNTDSRNNSLFSQEKTAGDPSGHLTTSNMGLQQTGESCLESNGISEDAIGVARVAPSACIGEKKSDGEEGKELIEKKASGVRADGIPGTKQKISASLLTEDKVSESGLEIETKDIEGSSNPSFEIESEKNKMMCEGLNSGVHNESKPATVIQPEFVKKTDEGLLVPSGSVKDKDSVNVDDVKSEKADETDGWRHVKDSEKKKAEWDSKASVTRENRVVAVSGSAFIDHKGETAEESSEAKVNVQFSDGPTPSKALTALQVQEAEQRARSRGSKTEVVEAEESTSTTADASFPAAAVSDMDAKVEFDLNEGFNGDDGKYGESNNLISPGCTGTVQLISPLPFAVSSVSSSLPASITVAAAAKGPFVPPEDLLRSKGALGWKGSAATSAFRPAEPRKVLEMSLSTSNVSPPDATAGKHTRPPLDIDLNVPDERILEDIASRTSAQDTASASEHTNNRDLAREHTSSAPVRCFGGLDLDLNRVEEPTDLGNLSTSNVRRPDIPHQSLKQSSGGPIGEVGVCRDFDLNNGPVDEVSAEPSLFSQHLRGSVPSQPSVSGLRVNNSETGNISSWFATGNYSAMSIPSILPDRGEQPFPMVATGGPQRMLGPPTPAAPFSPDVFRGSVLSSSPAVTFPSTSFPYPVFPFGNSFPLPSATFSGGSTTYVDASSGGRLCFPGVNSQLLGPAGTVPSHYPRPYVNLADGSNNVGVESSRKWGRQGLDLNAGPGGPDIEGRDETSPLAPRQLSVASSHTPTEEQARMYQVAGGILKRKVPEGGWDGYKQSSWQ
ncbi:hypothetical protein Pint_15391 [Pistacia integerrima]|uniref:Uncharacterized protein n=1 Tax=Pistacia integerrima TaxID=434235 RepID=A0ACC0ZG00_9ROSI|nr:hypothetical protein Pint_15391 [Pistacia integerrima]